MRFNLFTTLCALLATTQLATAANPSRPVTPVADPLSDRQKVALGTLGVATGCAIGAYICGGNGQLMATHVFASGMICCTGASGAIGILDNKQWDASVKKAGDKAKLTCGTVKDGAVVCGNWVIEAVGGVWQVVRRAATAERHFIAQKRAFLAKSIDGFTTRDDRKMRRSSPGMETRDWMPLRV